MQKYTKPQYAEGYNFSLAEKLIKYCKYGTQSYPESKTTPSNPAQMELLQELEKDLIAIGMKDVVLDENGYLYATLPANTDEPTDSIGFLGHVDTSSSVPGDNVTPQLVENYDGQEITLNEGAAINEENTPELKEYIGCTLVTSDGTSLLGADDKCGVTAILEAMEFLIKNRETQKIKHGEIKICFNPDEEIARGMDKINTKIFNPQYAYTLDGQSSGEIEAESFSADTVIVKFKGINIHPGYAKDIMINSIKVASYFIGSLPQDKLSPETTEKKEGYVHPHEIQGTEEETVIKFLIRDFDTDKLKEHEQLLEELAKKACDHYQGSSYELEVIEVYRNMRYELNKNPDVITKAEKAMQNLGIKPIHNSIRGGTDGVRLTALGIPTPNLFAGMHNIHSRNEWACIEEMEQAAMLIVEIVKV